MIELTEEETRLTIRAAAHVRPWNELRHAQRFATGVTEECVARVMLLLERGARPYLSAYGRWNCSGGPIPAPKNLTNVIGEMIRTGLVRHWRDREGDHLLPAPVHMRAEDGMSRCRFAGEAMGPMRSRLVSDVRHADCRDCEAGIAIDVLRGL
jgi:hypothetical protein